MNILHILHYHTYLCNTYQCVFCKINVTLDCENVKRVLWILNSIIENVIKCIKKDQLRSDFRKKFSLVGARIHESNHFRGVHYLGCKPVILNLF